MSIQCYQCKEIVPEIINGLCWNCFLVEEEKWDRQNTKETRALIANEPQYVPNITVQGLIALLQTMPQDAVVDHLWDGAPRTRINLVWLSRSGHVITSDYDEVCYYDEARPKDAPSEKDEPHWTTPERPLA